VKPWGRVGAKLRRDCFKKKKNLLDAFFRFFIRGRVWRQPKAACGNHTKNSDRKLALGRNSPMCALFAVCHVALCCSTIDMAAQACILVANMWFCPFPFELFRYCFLLISNILSWLICHYLFPSFCCSFIVIYFMCFFIYFASFCAFF
jgi:hypothetical protein